MLKYWSNFISYNGVEEYSDCYIIFSLTADDDSKELDDDYYNEVTGRKRVKVNNFNKIC